MYTGRAGIETQYRWEFLYQRELVLLRKQQPAKRELDIIHGLVTSRRGVNHPL